MPQSPVNSNSKKQGESVGKIENYIILYNVQIHGLDKNNTPTNV